MTVYRHRRELAMARDELSPLSDEQLEQELIAMRRDHPQYGETLAFGHLRSKGYRVTHSRLREQYVPQTPLIQLSGGHEVFLTDNSYTVPGPNSLWHIGKCIYNNIATLCQLHAVSTGCM